jgi:outer membrane protein OmpA-like peptidoglycan-associated protein
MNKRKGILLLLLAIWVGFCVVWFFTIYRKEDKKSISGLIIPETNSRVEADSTMTETTYHSTAASAKNDISQSGLPDTTRGVSGSTIKSAGPPTELLTSKGKEIRKDLTALPFITEAGNKKVSVCYFYHNSERKLKNFSTRITKELEQYLKSANVKIAITGHTDYIGSGEYNYRLGLQRAERVKRILIKKGIAAERIVILSKGEEEPVASNKSMRGRAKNRRVEINITLS